MDFKQIFKDRLAKLNPEQKAAVSSTEGPLMVIAGPGAGKTELLSLRVANIIKETDTPPSSILCLTFTDAAAANMRDRLSQIIGPEASKVAIHTFHSFGSEIINRYPEHFFMGANVLPADELKRLQIISDLLGKLPLTSNLTKKHPEQGLTYLQDVIRIISFLKQAGLPPKSFAELLEGNKVEIKQINELISTELETLTRISKKTIPLFQSLQDKIIATIPKTKNSFTQAFINILSNTLDQVDQEDSTKPLTNFKKQHLIRHPDTDKYILKDTLKLDLLSDLQIVYGQYQEQLKTQGVFDFDDMLLSVLEAMQNEPILRSELQERFLYIQVDEFQDTNGVQMQLLHELLDSPLYEGKPNICVVGDDDQSIYKFQGANIDNILSFKEYYPASKIITLTKNYRSSTKIIEYMLPVIKNADIRLENRIEEVSKELISGHATQPDSSIDLYKAPSFDLELTHATQKILELLNAGTPPEEIAIITRTHRELGEAVAYLSQMQIPINYERKENLLDQPAIKQLLSILKQAHYYSSSAPNIDESQLPELLSHPMFNISPYVIWDLSIRARKQRKFWLNLIPESHDHQLSQAGDLLISLADQSNTHPVSRLCGMIINNENEKEEGDQQESIFYKYYLSKSKVEKLHLIKQLQCLINFLKGVQPSKQLMLKDLVAHLSVIEQYRIRIPYTEHIGTQQQGVSLLTAHKAKGLEFKHVFILNASEQNWLKRKQSGKIRLPLNLNLLPAKEDMDDQIRLLYVGLSRAKTHLHISYHEETNTGRKQNGLNLLTQTDKSFQAIKSIEPLSIERQIAIQELTFLQLPPKATAATLLRSRLEYYKLSPSHLVSYLDILYSGPKSFFQSTLLGYPSAPSLRAAYGSAMHKALELMQLELRKTSTLPPLEYIVFFLKNALKVEPLTDTEVESLYQTGSDQLKNYYEQLKSTFSPEDLPEQNFSSHNICINGARLTGKLDRIAISKDSITVIDYKTGTSISDFTAAKNRYKAWKFKLQLGFYYLLLQNSPTGIVGNRELNTAIHFLDAQAEQKIEITYTPSPAELDELKELMGIIYKNITELHFPDTDHYPKTLIGINQFIADLKSKASS